MKVFVVAVTVGLICLSLFLLLCSSANLDAAKEAAPIVWERQGFRVVDYEGYKWGFYLGGNYGGAEVWHRLHKVPDNGITYSGFIQRWGDEWMVYGPTAIDAIRPR